MHLAPLHGRVSAILLAAALPFVVIACGDDSDVEDGGGGATSSDASSSATSPSSSSTTSSSSTAPSSSASTSPSSTSIGQGGSPDGSGGTGGQNTGGDGSGGDGGDGSGGAANAWHAPACAKVFGTAAATFSSNEGASVAERDEHLSGVSYASSIIVLDTPNTLLLASAGMLLRSTDAGCTYEDVAALPSSTFAKLVSAPGGKAYGFSTPEDVIFAIDGDTVIDLDVPGAGTPVGLAADPDDADHLRVVLEDGTMWDSIDGGDSWDPLGGEPPPEGCFYMAAFDPSDFDHVLCGTATTGTYFTTDAGDTWTRSESDVLWSQTMTIAISPVDGDVVWLEGHENGFHDGMPAGIDQKHIWRSDDGGATFTTVVLPNDPVEGDLDRTNLINGNLLVAHPTDPDVLYYVFGVGPQFEVNYGALYRVEASGEVHVEAQKGSDIDDYGSVAFNPADPDVVYFALTSERPSEG